MGSGALNTLGASDLGWCYPVWQWNICKKTTKLRDHLTLQKNTKAQEKKVWFFLSSFSFFAFHNFTSRFEVSVHGFDFISITNSSIAPKWPRALKNIYIYKMVLFPAIFLIGPSAILHIGILQCLKHSPKLSQNCKPYRSKTPFPAAEHFSSCQQRILKCVCVWGGGNPTISLRIKHWQQFFTAAHGGEIVVMATQTKTGKETLNCQIWRKKYYTVNSCTIWA